MKPGRRGAFLDFLRGATPFYASPRGIAVLLLEDAADDHRFIEPVRSESRAAYGRDQARVEGDPEMRAYLCRWRTPLAEPPTVEGYRGITP